MDRSGLVRFIAEQLRITEGIIAIDGASALGKSTFAHALAKSLGATVISTDSYLIPREQRTASCYDSRMRHLDALQRDVQALLNGLPIMLGEYNHITGQNDRPTLRLPSRINVVEGIHAFAVRNATPLNVKIFFDAAEDVLRASRRERDNRLGALTPPQNGTSTTTRIESTCCRYARKRASRLRFLEVLQEDFRRCRLLVLMVLLSDASCHRGVTAGRGGFAPIGSGSIVAEPNVYG